MTEWDQPPAGFTAVELMRIDPPANARRYHRITWEPTLFDEHAVMCTYGRRGVWRRARVTPFPTLEAAWTLIQASIKARLRHGYAVVNDSHR